MDCAVTTRRIMRRFAIDELAAVDRPAQQGALAVIMKRADDPVAKRTAVVLTSEAEGHAHALWLYPETTGGETSYAVSEGAENGHSHPWAFTVSGGIEIGASEGHTHTVEPLDLVAATMLKDASGPRVVSVELKKCAAAGAPEHDHAIDHRFAGPSGPASLGKAHVHPVRFGPDGSAVLGEAEGHTHGCVIKQAAEYRLPEKKKPKKEDEPMSKTIEQLERDVAERDTKISKLEGDLAQARVLAGLNDGEKAHLALLSEGDRPGFLAKSAADRAALITAANEVVYKATDGTLYTKRDDARTVALAKRADEQDKALRKASLEKRAGGLVALKGTADVVGAVLEAVDGIADEPTRKAAHELLVSANAAHAFVAKNLGTDTIPAVTEAANGGADSASAAEAQLEAATQALMKADPTLDYTHAYVKAAEQNPKLAKAASAVRSLN